MSRSSKAAALAAALLAAGVLAACGVKGAPRPRDPNAQKKDPLADLPFRPPVEQTTSIDAGMASLPDGGIPDAGAPGDAGTP